MLRRIVWDAALGGEEHAGQFGPEFLLRIVQVAEPVRVVESRRDSAATGWPVQCASS